MAKNVVLSSTAKQRLEELLVYLKQEWSEKVKNEFIEKLDVKINQVSQYPKSCPESKDFSGLHKCVVTKQTAFYYRINVEEIEIAALFDNRQDPKKVDCGTIINVITNLILCAERDVFVIGGKDYYLPLTIN